MNGSDPAPGQPPLPPGNPLGAYKSITAALGVAGSGDRPFVAPGTYDAANGEVFPLTSTAACSSRTRTASSAATTTSS